MRYTLRVHSKADRTLDQLRGRLAIEIAETLLDLRLEPRPEYSKPLKHSRELRGKRTIRVNGWRIIYQVNDQDRIVYVLDIGPRDANTYLNL